MNTTPFIPEPLFVFDSTSPTETGHHGTFDIINQPDYGNGVKLIGYTIPYGGERFSTHDEAKAYAKLFAASTDMLNAIQCALNLKDLWSAQQHGTVSADHAGEMQALQNMQDKLEAALKKATT